MKKLPSSLPNESSEKKLRISIFITERGVRQEGKDFKIRNSECGIGNVEIFYSAFNIPHSAFGRLNCRIFHAILKKLERKLFIPRLTDENRVY